MKKLLSLLLVLAMVMSMVACGGSGTTTTETTTEPSTEAQETEAVETAEGKIYDGVVLEMTSRLAGVQLEELQALIAGYEEETGCVIELTTYPTDEYANMLKTRMASGSLPDLWETHGWSRLLYGEYLTPVNDQDWYANQTNLATGVLEGEGDTAYALCLVISGVYMIWNQTKCEELGIDPYAIYTWDDFKDAMQTAVDAGIIPISTFAQAGCLCNMTGVFCSYEDSIVNDSAAQLDGTWDWESFRYMTQLWADLFDMGAMWPDVTTADTNMQRERVATGDSIVMVAVGVDHLTVAKELNPDNEFVYTPIPAVSEESSMYLFNGETYSVGVWNESENADAAMGFLAYMSEYGDELATQIGGMSALSTITVSESYAINALNDLVEAFPDVVSKNMWDREYMPSGMWNVAAEACGMLFADWSEEGQTAVIEFMKTNYQEKYAAAHE